MKTNINTITEEILMQINADRVAAGYAEVTAEELELMLIDMAKAARIRRAIREGYGNEANPFCGADITGEEIANIAYWLWKNNGYTSSVQRLVSVPSVHAISARTCGDALPGGAKIEKGNKREWVGEWTYSLDIQPIMIVEDDDCKRLAIPVTEEQLVTFARFFEVKDAQHRALSFHKNYCHMSDIGRRSLFPITFTVNASYATKSQQFLSCNAEGKGVKKTWNRTLQYNSGLLDPDFALIYEAIEDMATGYVKENDKLARSVLYGAVNFGHDEGKYGVDAMGDYLCEVPSFNSVDALVAVGVVEDKKKDHQRVASVINDYLLAWCDYSEDADLFGKVTKNGNRTGAVRPVRLCFALGMMAAIIESVAIDGDEITRENMANKIHQAMAIKYHTRTRKHSLRTCEMADTARGSVIRNIRDLSYEVIEKRKSTKTPKYVKTVNKTNGRIGA